MKKWFVLSVIVISITACILQGISDDPFRTTASMDGLGHYRIDTYTIDSAGCLDFIDNIGEKVHFCGSYKLTTADEHRITYIKNYIPGNHLWANQSQEK